MMQDIKKKKLRILIVFNSGGLGNVILTIPLLIELKRLFPDCKRILLGPPSFLELLNTPELSEEVHSTAGSRFIRYWRLLKSINFFHRFDYCFIPRAGNDRYLFKIAQKYKIIGKKIYFSNEETELSLKRRIDIHEIVENLELLKRVNVIPNFNVLPQLFIKDGEKTRAIELMHRYKLATNDFIVFHLGLRPIAAYKAFPKRLFEQILTALRHDNMPKVIICGKDERPYIERFLDSKQYEIMVIDTVENLRELAAFLSFSRVMITVDTGPMHIAAAAGANIIALFGPSNIIRCSPRGKGIINVLTHTTHLNCNGCYDHWAMQGCFSERECLARISVEEIVKLIHEIPNYKS